MATMAPLFSSSLALGSQQSALFIALSARASDGGSLITVILPEGMREGKQWERMWETGLERFF